MSEPTEPRVALRFSSITTCAAGGVSHADDPVDVASSLDASPSCRSWSSKRSRTGVATSRVICGSRCAGERHCCSRARDHAPPSRCASKRALEQALPKLQASARLSGGTKRRRDILFSFDFSPEHGNPSREPLSTRAIRHRSGSIRERKESSTAIHHALPRVTVREDATARALGAHRMWTLP